MIYKLTLVFHLIALVLLAGSTLFSFLGFKMMSNSKDYNHNFLSSTIKIANLGFGLGAALFLLSGITFIIMASGYTSQIWFKVKMAAILCIIINNRAFGWPAMKQIVKSPDNDVSPTIFQRLTTYYYIQFFILVTILVLSVFKFN